MQVNIIKNDVLTFWQNHRRSLWLWWVTAQICSAVIVTIILEIEIHYAGTGSWSWRPFVFALVWLLLGAIPGIAEAFVLRKYIQISVWRWIFTTIIGKGIIDELTIQWYLNPTLPTIVESFLRALLYGVVIGFLQWLILRNRINYAGWWIIILIFGGFIRDFVGQTLNTFISPSFVLVSTVGTAVLYGALTGMGLAVLMQSLKQESQVSPLPADDFLPTFSQRLGRATLIGIMSALIYLLAFSNSYAAVVGDLLLGLITGDAYYRIDDQRLYSLVHLINAICWFLIGSLPFLVTKRIMSGILLWVGIGMGLVICGFLIIIVAVSPMWP